MEILFKSHSGNKKYNHLECLIIQQLSNIDEILFYHLYQK